MNDECPRCGCPTSCPEGRYEAGRDFGLAVGALFGIFCAAGIVFVVSLIAWLA